MYEPKTDLQDIDGERFYYLWTHQGYTVFHWNKNTKQLDKISSIFFIKLEDAQAQARTYMKLSDERERLAMKIRALQDEIDLLEKGGL